MLSTTYSGKFDEERFSLFFGCGVGSTGGGGARGGITVTGFFRGGLCSFVRPTFGVGVSVRPVARGAFGSSFWTGSGAFVSTFSAVTSGVMICDALRCAAAISPTVMGLLPTERPSDQPSAISFLISLFIV